MGELGVERLFVRPFDAAFAAWPPDRFVRELVAGALAAQAVVVGQSFRFGARRAGDLPLLQSLGKALDFEVVAHATASDASGPYSSTRAREAVADGRMLDAAAVLGRPHELSGVVVHGDERGRTIGVRRRPTCILHPGDAPPRRHLRRSRRRDRRRRVRSSARGRRHQRRHAADRGRPGKDRRDVHPASPAISTTFACGCRWSIACATRRSSPRSTTSRGRSRATASRRDTSSACPPSSGPARRSRLMSAASRRMNEV